MKRRGGTQRVSKAYVETSECLLEELDEMVREGYYHDRSEAVNDALQTLIRNYKLAKLRAKDQREGLHRPEAEAAEAERQSDRNKE